MIKWSKMIILVVGIWMMAGIGGIPASAQSTCGELNRDDCALLKNAQRITTDLNAAEFKAIVEFSFGMRPFSEIFDIRLIADGVYARTPTMRQDVDDTYSPLYTLNADMNVLVDGRISSLIQPTNNTLTTNLALRYVDGIGYAELSKVLSRVGETWYSLDMLDFLTKLIRDEILPENVLDILNLLFSADYVGILAMDGYLRRLDDVQTAFQTFAVFEGVLSFDAFLDDNPIIYNALISAMEDNIRNFVLFRNSYTDDEISRAAQFYVEGFRGIDIRIIQTVGFDDGYIHQTQFEFTFEPETSPAPDPDPLGIAIFRSFELRFFVDFRYTQFENIPFITKPTSSTPVRYEDLFQDGDNSLF